MRRYPYPFSSASWSRRPSRRYKFIILLEDTANAGDATLIAERITEVLETPLAVEGHELSITANIGIAMSASSRDRPNDLLRNADVAMYRAKEQGEETRYMVFEARA